mmetsp:Transcript_51764/g.84787  ORF Transcript_51764/g.84787 Transcript_51764/m.84787 type:complete len:80 (-) Transcript_51764:74-313(-)
MRMAAWWMSKIITPPAAVVALPGAKGNLTAGDHPRYRLEAAMPGEIVKKDPRVAVILRQGDPAKVPLRPKVWKNPNVLL